MTIQTLITQFRQRPAREQKILIGGALLLILAGLASLAEWTYHEQQRLTQAVPHARIRLQQMQNDAAALLELQRDQAQDEQIDLATAAQAAKAAALAHHLTLEVENTGTQLRVAGEGHFRHLIDWLAALQAEQHLSAAQLTLRTTEERTIYMEATLSLPDDAL